MKARIAAGLLFAVAAVSSTHAAAPGPSQVVGWRNDGTGRFPDAEPVTEWSKTSHVLWSAKVGSSASSPIAVEGKVLVTAEPDLLVCLDAGTGKERWRKAHGLSDLPPELNARDLKLPALAGYTVPTPVSDGRRVYAWFGTGVAACYDLDGNRQWIRWLDVPQPTNYGRTASPVLVGGKVILHPGPLVCLDAATGKLLWQNEEAKAAYGTPAAARVGEVDIVITPRGDVVRVADGKTLTRDLGHTGYVSPVVQEGVVYFVDVEVVAVKLPEKIGDKFEAKELWHEDLEGEFFASPVVSGGLVHTVDKDAVYYVLDAKTGKTVLKETLKLPPAGRESATILVYPSLALAGRHLFAANCAGDTMVLNPGRKLDEVRLNEMGQGSGGSFAFSGKRIFMRGGDLIYCVGVP